MIVAAGIAFFGVQAWELSRNVTPATATSGPDRARLVDRCNEVRNPTILSFTSSFDHESDEPARLRCKDAWHRSHLR